MSNIVANYGKENGFSGVMVDPNYHMDFAALKTFMPEKAEIVQKVFELEGHHFTSYPHPHSLPVYDVELGRIFYSASLDRRCYESSVSIAISLAVKKSINNNTALSSWYADIPHCINVEGHHFIAVEDVPLKILKIALERQKEERQKKENDEQKAKDFCKASSELDKALKVAKELLK